jgi:hypothetical protein
VKRFALLALLLSSCTLFDDRPDRTCKSDTDCFRAQGEVCNTSTNTCEDGPDAGTAFTDDIDEEQP